MKRNLLSPTLLFLVMAVFGSCQDKPSTTNDYICHDGFLLQKGNYPSVPSDTLLLHGILSDGTHYYIRQEPHSKSTITERASNGKKQALIMVGNVNPVLAIDGFEAIVQTPDSLKKIPLYTDSNYYRFSGVLSRNKGRIDLRFPIVPSIPNELRNTSFTIAHQANTNLLVLMINQKFINLKRKGMMPKSIDDISAYMTFDLDGIDKECLCIRIESRKGMELQAKKDAKRCLEMFMRENITESELNITRDTFRRMVEEFYFNHTVHQKTFSQLLSKRIADAFVQGNDIYDYKAEGEFLISFASYCDTDFINEMYKQTIINQNNNEEITTHRHL